ncbi:hypothetical protein ACX80S_19020 [Arthrobacter sp. RHLT1-20]
MPLDVVYVLKTIDIEEENVHSARVLGKGIFEAFKKQRTVGEPGQGITKGQYSQLLRLLGQVREGAIRLVLRLTTRRDIPEAPDAPDYLVGDPLRP